jgi:pimeloyl-ACP methyl ester carboxylesterase
MRPVASGECLAAVPDRTRTLDLAIHANESGKLIVIFPGYGASLDAEDPELDDHHPFRYREIACDLQTAGIGAVVRAGNRQAPYFRYEEQIVNDLRAVMDHALKQAVAICGGRHPPLYLMGYSAGASAVAVLADEVGAARVLLLAPSGDAGPDRIAPGFGNYRGEVYIVVCERDEVVTSDAGPLFDEMSPRAAKKRVVIVPGGDHFFSGEAQDRIFRKAPFWAFSDEPGCEELLRA